ncbi:MAG: FtsX-like permease family protein [Promethearchaeota archaeon]
MFSKISNTIFLTYELIIENRRLALPTMIGLIIALTVISHTGALIDSYRQEIFEETVFNPFYGYSAYQGDVEIELYLRDILGTYLTAVQGSTHNPELLINYDVYDKYIEKSIDLSHYSDYISQFFWYSTINFNVWINKSGHPEIPEQPKSFLGSWSTEIFTSSSLEFFDQLEKNLKNTGSGRLPQTSSEIIFIRPSSSSLEELDKSIDSMFENFTLNAKINLTTHSYHTTLSLERPNKTVTIVGIVEYERNFDSKQVIEGSNSDLLRTYLNEHIYQYYFLTKPAFLNQTLFDFSEMGIEELWRIGEIKGKIFLDHSHFNAYNVNSEISQLEKFLISLENKVYPVTNNPFVYSKILEDMRNFANYIFGLLVILLLISTPVLCIALFLVVYSFGLIRRQKQEQIGVIKMRGGSWVQIFSVLLGELVIFTLLAVIIGFFASIFLADIVMRSTNYLEFLGVQMPVRITINFIQSLLFWGIVLTFLLNFKRILQMSRQPIKETIIPVETQDPLWKRYYLDLLSFLIGTCVWMMYTSLIKSKYLGEYESFVSSLLLLISLFALLAPFLIFFSTIMLITRISPFLIQQLSKILWRVIGGVPAISIRNIIRHKQATNRAIILITLALSFTILSSSLIFSLDETERVKIYYQGGADISLNLKSKNTRIRILLEENISNIQSISSVILAENILRSSEGQKYQFLFLEPDSYTRTAFNDPNRFELSSSLSKLMEEISDNQTVILYEENLKATPQELKIYENLSLLVSNTTSTEGLSLRIGGTFKYWPLLYPHPWYDFSSTYWLVGSIGLFERLNKDNYIDIQDVYYFASVDSSGNIDETIHEIYNETGITPKSPGLEYQRYQASFTRRFTLSVLNSNLIICICISVIGIIMFAFFIYVERGKEIGVERALGMTRLQTAQSYLIEAITILVFGSVIGIITGMFYVTMFLQITQFGQTVPPPVVTLPITLFAQIIIVIIIAAAIGTIIPAYLATRKDISHVLKVE